MVAATLLWEPFPSGETVARIAAFGRLVPPTTRLLYGGMTWGGYDAAPTAFTG